MSGLLCCADSNASPSIQPPQRRSGIKAFADAIDIEGVVAAVLRERASAVRAEAAAVALPPMRIDAQAGVFVRVKWAEEQAAPASGSCAIPPQQIVEMCGLIIASDRDPIAVPPCGCH
jgi:uncharacterized protein (DUF2267 family)